MGADSGRFVVWDLFQRSVSHSFDAGDHVVRARWTPDGARLLVATLNGPLLVRTGDGRKALGAIEMQHHRLRDLAVEPGGSAWATCGEDIVVRVWNPETMSLRFELKDGQAASTAVGFLNGFIVAGYEDGFSVGWTLDGTQRVLSTRVLNSAVYSLGVHPPGERVIFGGGKGGMCEMIVGPPKEWKLGNQWSNVPPRPIAVNAIDFAADGRFVAAFSDDHAMVFNSTRDDAGTGLGFPFYYRSPKPEWNPDFIVSGACFIPNSNLVATSHFDGKLRLWQDNRLSNTLNLP